MTLTENLDKAFDIISEIQNKQKTIESLDAEIQDLSKTLKDLSCCYRQACSNSNERPFRRIYYHQKSGELFIVDCDFENGNIVFESGLPINFTSAEIVDETDVDVVKETWQRSKRLAS